MTVTVPPDGGNVANPPPSTCSLCGARMAAGQEWCLECGAARTVIARAPDWRVPVLVVATVVLVVVGAFVVALTSLSSNAGKVTVIGANKSTTSAKVQIGSWPAGLDGYTVLLSYAPSQAAADAAATKLIADHVPGVGVLATSKHPIMRPVNVYYVYVGRDTTLDGAKAEATQLKVAGQTAAKAALVQKPGGA